MTGALKESLTNPGKQLVGEALTSLIRATEVAPTPFSKALRIE